MKTVMGNREARGDRRITEEAITQTTNSLPWGVEAEGGKAGRRQEMLSTKYPDSGILCRTPWTRGLLIRCDDDAAGGDGDGGGQWALLTSRTGLVGSRAIWCILGTLQNLFCSR